MWTAAAATRWISHIDAIMLHWLPHSWQLLTLQAVFVHFSLTSEACSKWGTAFLYRIVSTYFVQYCIVSTVSQKCHVTPSLAVRHKSYCAILHKQQHLNNVSRASLWSAVLTLVSAWKPLSVNCEQPAASNVLQLHTMQITHQTHKHIQQMHRLFLHKIIHIQTKLAMSVYLTELTKITTAFIHFWHIIWLVRRGQCTPLCGSLMQICSSYKAAYTQKIFNTEINWASK